MAKEKSVNMRAFLEEKMKNQLPSYKEIIDSMENHQSITVHGFIPEAYPILLQKIMEDHRGNLLMVTPTDRIAQKLTESINQLTKGLAFWYPEAQVQFYNIGSLEDEGRQKRLQALMALVEKDRKIIVASVFALRQKISTPKAFAKEALTFDMDGNWDLENLLKKLIFMRYRRVHMVEAVGDFSFRGGILDIYPPHLAYPVRIEFFDTQVDSMRIFDIASQRSLKKIQKVKIGPATEFILSQKEWDLAAKGLNQDLHKAIEKKQGNTNFLQDKFFEILGKIKEGIYVENTDLLIPYLEEESYASLVDYFGKDDYVFTQSLSRLYENMQSDEQIYKDDVTFQLERGELLPAHEKILFGGEDSFQILLYLSYALTKAELTITIPNIISLIEGT